MYLNHPRCTAGVPEHVRAVAHGKQVKLDGVHFADAISEAAAAIIADTLNHAGLAGEMWPAEVRNRVEAYLA